jgi:sulfatase maturation enzyme AslB (radical SAM superfamily)
METIINKEKQVLKNFTVRPAVFNGKPAKQCPWMERKFIRADMKIKIFILACRVLKKPKIIFHSYRSVISLRKNIWGGEMKKMYRIDGKYYFNIYTPGWPSETYDTIWEKELRRHAPGNSDPEKTFFAFLAITRKCPMRCEHCFEWDNLNQKESFTKEELLKVADMYQQQGVKQFHFSGGEPMTRL